MTQRASSACRLAPSSPIDGHVRFRLWAPARSSVELVLPDSRVAQLLHDEPLENGWFELVTDEARAGSRYRYRIDGKLEVPDPASRCNPDDVHGPSVVVDPAAVRVG